MLFTETNEKQLKNLLLREQFEKGLHPFIADSTLNIQVEGLDKDEHERNRELFEQVSESLTRFAREKKTIPPLGTYRFAGETIELDVYDEIIYTENSATLVIEASILQ